MTITLIFIQLRYAYGVFKLMDPQFLIQKLDWGMGGSLAYSSV